MPRNKNERAVYVERTQDLHHASELSSVAAKIDLKEPHPLWDSIPVNAKE